jgi:hypothetical protein
MTEKLCSADLGISGVYFTPIRYLKEEVVSTSTSCREVRRTGTTKQGQQLYGARRDRAF